MLVPSMNLAGLMGIHVRQDPLAKQINNSPQGPGVCSFKIQLVEGEWEGRADQPPGVTRDEQHRERQQVQILPAHHQLHPK